MPRVAKMMEMVEMNFIVNVGLLLSLLKKQGRCVERNEFVKLMFQIKKLVGTVSAHRRVLYSCVLLKDGVRYEDLAGIA